jgi:hypothetical protein
MYTLFTVFMCTLTLVSLCALYPEFCYLFVIISSTMCTLSIFLLYARNSLLYPLYTRVRYPLFYFVHVILIVTCSVCTIYSVFLCVRYHQFFYVYVILCSTMCTLSSFLLCIRYHQFYYVYVILSSNGTFLWMCQNLHQILIIICTSAFNKKKQESQFCVWHNP